mgnify:CR=1 FL=1
MASSLSLWIPAFAGMTNYNIPSQKLVHDIHIHQPFFAMVKAFGQGADNLEAKRLPQLYFESNVVFGQDLGLGESNKREFVLRARV